ncbi:MAG: hypothetical protein PF904_03415 [Kiritimatiellae bacterium]|jgi:hypothetical protein|nr:hypothetical protein [Kiritimatiellia bacterium]
MKFSHVGIPVFEKQDDMVLIDACKVWVTDCATSTYKVEYLFFEPDSPMPAAIQDETHIAYEVDDLEAAVEGKSILVPICEPMPGLKMAFIYDEGLAVELLQIEG